MFFINDYLKGDIKMNLNKINDEIIPNLQFQLGLELGFEIFAKINGDEIGFDIFKDDNQIELEDAPEKIISIVMQIIDLFEDEEN